MACVPHLLLMECRILITDIGSLLIMCNLTAKEVQALAEDLEALQLHLQQMQEADYASQEEMESERVLTELTMKKTQKQLQIFTNVLDLL